MKTYKDFLLELATKLKFSYCVITCLVIIIVLSNICTFYIAKNSYGKKYGQCLEDMSEFDRCCATSKKCMAIKWRHLN